MGDGSCWYPIRDQYFSTIDSSICNVDNQAGGSDMNELEQTLANRGYRRAECGWWDGAYVYTTREMVKRVLGIDYLAWQTSHA